MNTTIHYGNDELIRIHGTLEPQLPGLPDDFVREIAVNAYLSEAYELEVRNHGGLTPVMIDKYHHIAKSFLGMDDDSDINA